MLQDFFIKKTKTSPLITLNEQRNGLKIKGILRPEDSIEFFIPLINWLDEYRLKPMENFNFEVDLEYFNTSSSIMLLEMMRKIGGIPHQKISWIVDSYDEDMIETVGEYNELLGGTIDLHLKG